MKVCSGSSRTRRSFRPFTVFICSPASTISTCFTGVGSLPRAASTTCVRTTRISASYGATSRRLRIYPRELETLLFESPDLDILDDRLGRQHERGPVLPPPALSGDLPELNNADEVFPVGFRMPFLDPFEPVPRNVFPIVEAEVDADVEVVGQLMRRVVIQFCVLVFILVAQRRQVAQYRGSGRERAGALAIKKLFVREPAFDHD